MGCFVMSNILPRHFFDGLDKRPNVTRVTFSIVFLTLQFSNVLFCKSPYYCLSSFIHTTNRKTIFRFIFLINLYVKLIIKNTGTLIPALSACDMT
jgi:hypothetical protein